MPHTVTRKGLAGLYLLLPQVCRPGLGLLPLSYTDLHVFPSPADLGGPAQATLVPFLRPVVQAQGPCVLTGLTKRDLSFKQSNPLLLLCCSALLSF